MTMNDPVFKLMEVLSDLDKMDYISRVCPGDESEEALSYGEVKKELMMANRCQNLEASTPEERNLLTEKLDISKEMALLENWAKTQ